MKELEHVQNICRKSIDAEKKAPVLKYKPPEQVLRDLDLTISDSGKSMDQLFDLLEKIVMMSPRIGNNKFFNLLFGGRIMPAVAADMFVPLVNNTMHTYKAAGVHILNDGDPGPGLRDNAQTPGSLEEKFFRRSQLSLPA